MASENTSDLVLEGRRGLLPRVRFWAETNWLLGLSVFLLLILEWYYWYYTVDDAFISFRYVRNLLDGHGLVFNPGERVEGYSNFLWVMVLAALGKFFPNIPLVAKILGVVSGVGDCARYEPHCAPGKRAGGSTEFGQPTRSALKLKCCVCALVGFWYGDSILHVPRRLWDLCFSSEH